MIENINHKVGIVLVDNDKVDSETLTDYKIRTRIFAKTILNSSPNRPSIIFQWLVLHDFTR